MLQQCLSGVINFGIKSIRLFIFNDTIDWKNPSSNACPEKLNLESSSRISEYISKTFRFCHHIILSYIKFTFIKIHPIFLIKWLLVIWFLNMRTLSSFVLQWTRPTFSVEILYSFGASDLQRSYHDLQPHNALIRIFTRPASAVKYFKIWKPNM